MSALRANMSNSGIKSLRGSQEEICVQSGRGESGHGEEGVGRGKGQGCQGMMQKGEKKEKIGGKRAWGGSMGAEGIKFSKMGVQQTPDVSINLLSTFILNQINLSKFIHHPILVYEILGILSQNFIPIGAYQNLFLQAKLLKNMNKPYDIIQSRISWTFFWGLPRTLFAMLLL